MKYKILLAISILFLFFVNSISATITEYDNPWEPFTQPDYPIDGNCWNLGYFNNVTPHNGDWNVDITAKGVQVCVNVTPPQGCSLNVTYEWLNYTQYYSDWLDWTNAQPWGDWWDFEDWYEDIDWDNQTTWKNNSYWYEFSPTYSGINQITQICAYNTNVSCQIENDFTREFFDWRINYTLNCSGQFTQDYCYYYFEPEECQNITYIYPPSPNGTACPCCEAMCVGVNNDLGHPMNVTIWGREDDYGYYNIWTHYENISNGTYCFCMDDITPSAPAHAIGHSHTQQNVTIIDTWYNVTFDHGEAEHINCNPVTGICNIELYGHYDVRYWCVVQDEDANPTGHKMAVRILQNGTDEIDGSYREVTFSKQGHEQHIIGFVHEHFVPGTTLRFQYIGDDTDQSIDTDGTWSTDDINFYAEIMRMDNEEHMPLKYNTTYYWYVNITDAETGEYEVTDTFQFRTPPDPSWCPCGPEDLTALMEDTDTIRSDTWIVGLIFVLMALPLAVALKKRKKKRKNQTQIYPMEFRRNY